MFSSVTLVGLLQAAAVITVLFSLLTALGIPHHLVELFTHFRLQYLVAAVVLLLAFAWLRSVPYSLALLVAVVVNAWLVLPWYFDGKPATGTDIGRAAQIRLLHANILSTNRNFAKLKRLIDDENPDIIFLQEFNAAWAEDCEALRDDFPFSYTEPRAGNFGIAVYSRLQLVSATHVDAPPFGYPTIFLVATVGGRPVNFVSTHPTIPLGRNHFEARNTHLEFVTDRLVQLEGPVILSGDFNASLWDGRLKRLEAKTGLVNTRRGHGIAPTWPTFLPFAMIPIDHTLVSPGIEVLESRTGRRIGSDHLPLVVTLAL